MILLTYIIKDDDRFLPELFLDHEFYDKETKRKAFEKVISK